MTSPTLRLLSVLVINHKRYICLEVSATLEDSETVSRYSGSSGALNTNYPTPSLLENWKTWTGWKEVQKQSKRDV